MSRITNDPKESMIKFRLSDDLKSWIEDQAKRKNKSASEYIRDILEKEKRSMMP